MQSRAVRLLEPERLRDSCNTDVWVQSRVVLRAARAHLSVWCGAALVRECCTLSMCTSLVTDGACRVHDHRRVPLPNGSDHALSRPFLPTAQE